MQGGPEDAEGPLGRTVYYDTTAVITVFYAFPMKLLILILGKNSNEKVYKQWSRLLDEKPLSSLRV